MTVSAQKTPAEKPLLFAGLPSNIQCTAAQLSNLFAVSKGQNINVTLADNFNIAGPVKGKLSTYHNLQTVIIQLPAFNNTLFSLSRQTDENNQISYVGRIINPSYADGFELKQMGNGNYEFIKINLANILETCHQ